MRSSAHDSYKDDNGVVLFALDPNTGTCTQATVTAKRRDERSFTYFGVDSSGPFLPTHEEREAWARVKLAEFVDKTR